MTPFSRQCLRTIDSVYAICHAGPVSDLADRLLDAARQLLTERGLDAVTIREVARMAGVSHGAPRRHFPSRAQLLAALAARGFAELGDRVRRAATGVAPGPALLAAASAYVDQAAREPAMFDLMVRHDLVRGSGFRLRERSLPLVEVWVELYAAAHPDGDRTAALVSLAAVHGIADLVAHQAIELVGDPAVLVRAACGLSDDPAGRRGTSN